MNEVFELNQSLKFLAPSFQSAEKYFEQSEQLPTAFKIIVGQNEISENLRDGVGWIGGGMMLQQLPKENYSKNYWANYNPKKKPKPHP